MRRSAAGAMRLRYRTLREGSFITDENAIKCADKDGTRAVTGTWRA